MSRETLSPLTASGNPIARRRMTRWRLVAWAVAIIPIAAAGIGAHAADRAPTRVAVNAPAAIAKRAAAIGQMTDAERWEEAIEALIALMDASPDELMEAEPGRFVRVDDWGNAQIASWPEAARENYRMRVDPRARLMWKSIDPSGDTRDLKELCDRFPCTMAGVQARWALARNEWERGQIEDARRLWEGLLAVPLPRGVSSFREVDVLARLVLCSIVERDFARASEELQFLQQRYGQETGVIAGQSGTLGVLLARVFEDAQRNTAGSEIGSRQYGHSNPALRIGGALWSVDLARADGGTSIGDAVAGPAASVYWPIVDHDRVFVVSETDVRCLKLEDGRPYWPSDDANDDGSIYRSPNPAFVGRIPGIGIPSYSGAVAGGRLFALTGPPIAGGGAGSVELLRPRLVALDIGRGEGRLEWIQDEKGSLAHQEWTPVGSPIASNDAVWIPVQRDLPRGELAVARLRAMDGAVQWIRPVLTPLVEGDGDLARWDSCWLAGKGGSIFLLTNAGAIAAVDADLGILSWVAAFPVSPLTTDELNNPIRNRTSPPIFWRGLVIVTPRGTGGVRAYRADNGQFLWKCELDERGLQGAGVSGSSLVVSGRRLWGIDMTTGRIRWRVGFDDEDGSGAGTAAVMGDVVFWCSRTELLCVDATTGSVLQRDPLRERFGVSGGSVFTAGDRALIATADRLTALDVETGGAQRMSEHARGKATGQVLDGP